MRRVIDDEHYDEIAAKIEDVIFSIPAETVSEYNYGTYRAMTGKIVSAILNNVANIKLGNDMNTTGIGNNWCKEIIYTGNPKEEQIIGLLHCTDDMFGCVYCSVTDYDGGRKTKSRKIHGCNPKDEYGMKHFRFSV